MMRRNLFRLVLRMAMMLAVSLVLRSLVSLVLLAVFSLAVFSLAVFGPTVFSLSLGLGMWLLMLGFSLGFSMRLKLFMPFCERAAKKAPWRLLMPPHQVEFDHRFV